MAFVSKAVRVAAGEAFGPFQRKRLVEAIEIAERQTGMHFPVYVGGVPGDLDTFVHDQLTDLTASLGEVALIVVDPARRRLQIATSRSARARLTDNACALATLSMTTSFSLGDLTGGLVVGLRMLADATAPRSADHGRPTPTSATVTRGV